MTTVDSDKTSELGDNVIHDIHELMNEWQDRLRLDNLRLADRYLKGELKLLTEFRIRGISKQYVAYFQRAMSIGGTVEPAPPHGNVGNPRGMSSHSFDIQHSQVNALKCRSDCYQQTVFVDVIQLVQDEKLVPLPSTVWLGSVDCIYSIIPHALYFSCASGRAFVFRGILGDGKVYLPGGPIVGEISATSDPQLHRQVVKGASQAMDCLPSDLGNTNGNVFDARDVIDELSRIRIALGFDFVRLGRVKGFQFRIEFDDVLFGPFDFRPNTKKFV